MLIVSKKKLEGMLSKQFEEGRKLGVPEGIQEVVSLLKEFLAKDRPKTIYLEPVTIEGQTKIENNGDLFFINLTSFGEIINSGNLRTVTFDVHVTGERALFAAKESIKQEIKEGRLKGELQDY